MLLISLRLTIEHRLWVHLTQLIDLDVRHRRIHIHALHLARLLSWCPLTRQHVVVHSTVLRVHFVF